MKMKMEMKMEMKMKMKMIVLEYIQSFKTQSLVSAMSGRDSTRLR